MAKGKGRSRAAANNRSNQMNPNNPAYAASRSYTKAMADNRSNQLNPNSEAFRKSREGGEHDSGVSGSSTGWQEKTGGTTDSPKLILPTFGRGGEVPRCSGCQVAAVPTGDGYRCPSCGTVWPRTG